MQVNIFDGYAIYAIKDNTVNHTEATSDNDDAQTEQKRLPAATSIGGMGNG